jgi:autotransporter-associated beta strand protein
MSTSRIAQVARQVSAAALSLLALCFSLAPVQVRAGSLYWDFDATSDLTAGDGNWSDSKWATSATPGTATPGAWADGSDAYFQTGGSNNVTIASGTAYANGLFLANSVNGTILILNGPGTLTTAGINIGKGQVIVRGSSVITNTGTSRITESGDSNSKSYYFMDDAIINGGSGNLETHRTQAAQSVYIRIQDRARATFANVLFGPNAEYADNSGHNTVLEVMDTAQLTATTDMYVMQKINDQNRGNAGGARVHIQVYQHGGTVSVGRDLRLCDNDPVKDPATVKHEVDGAYNLGAGSLLKVGGIITGGKTRTGVGQSYFNFHGGTLTYTGAGAQTDWINLTASAVTDGIDSTENLRVWEGATIDTGSQNVTVAQALLGPTGQGVSAIDIAGLTGTVYNNACPPWVFITADTAGGDTTGSGASAVPTLDATGYITGFIITNPGNDYTLTPKIWLIRGDTGATGTVVPAANITLAANSSYTGGLTKLGSGTLALTATNTYVGATVVSNGTLRLTQPQCLSTNTAVTAASGTVLNLDFTGTQIVRSLQVGAVVKPSGVYTAAKLPGVITGTGTLETLLPPPNGMLLVIR